MNGSARAVRRPPGEPLLALGLIVGGWLGLRIAFWEPPFGSPAQAAISASNPRMLPRDGAKTVAVLASGLNQGLALRSSPSPQPTLTLTDGAFAEPVRSPETSSTGLVASQKPVLAAAFASMRLPPAPIAALAGQEKSGVAIEQAPPLAPLAFTPATVSHWSGDVWLLARNGSRGPIAIGQPSYGRSQAGAVLRYGLAPSSGHRPTLYARATAALAGPRESEGAMGLAARPIAGVPLSFAAEVRLSDSLAHREVRPVAFAVTELPPVKLPLDLRAEVYAQAGYVAGRFATTFLDGQARLDGPLANVGGHAALRAGAGVWGGAQNQAARLDLGPSATAAFCLGRTQARVTVDYRWRVAGDAEPKSGPALTISAGF